MILSSARIRAYARTVDAGLRTINEVDEDYRVAVCVELIARYDYVLDEVDTKYAGEVKKELGIQEKLVTA